MPINTRHKEYIAREASWRQMRDFIAGQAAVHARGEVYLPRLVAEPPALYEARKARAGVFGATGRTVEGLVGMLFRANPECEVSPGTESMLADVTKAGEALDAFAAMAAEERLSVGRVAILVDFPPAAPGAQLTRAAAEAQNIRPHLARYATEALINWEYGWINNKTVLTMAVLEEEIHVPDPQDPFIHQCLTQWRELRLVEGVYTVQLWRDGVGGGGQERCGEPIVPLLAGLPLAEIPLKIIGDGRPPLMALCDVNKGHYQSTADIEQGAHQTALPQPWIAGSIERVDKDGNAIPVELYIGGGCAWMFPQGTQVGMLEYLGTGLGAIENRLTAKEGQMAVLGARMLEAQKSGVEAADTAGMHRAGEQSILQRQAGELSASIEGALAIFDRWAGGTGEVKYQINKDFLPTALTAQELTALVGAWQSGAISHEELFGKLQRGGVISEGADYETEQEKIKNNPAMPAAPAPAAPAVPPADA